MTVELEDLGWGLGDLIKKSPNENNLAQAFHIQLST